jgi:hypothetical protein
MRGVIVYESMFGNTRHIAEAIATALGEVMEVHVIRASDMTAGDLTDTDLLVVGAPTHAWGLPRTNTRRSALNSVRKAGSDLVLEPLADSSPGVREWLATLDTVPALVAIFDTRFRAPAFVTGRAATSIAASLRRREAHVIAPLESFLVDRQNHLVAGELRRARAWGMQLGGSVTTTVRSRGPS